MALGIYANLVGYNWADVYCHKGTRLRGNGERAGAGRRWSILVTTERAPPRQTEMSTAGSKANSISGPANFNPVTTERAPPGLGTMSMGWAALGLDSLDRVQSAFHALCGPNLPL